MEWTREEAVARLARYVNMPSGSRDIEGLSAFSAVVAADMEALGFHVTRHSAPGVGDTLECTYGSGADTLLLLGHMDTVFTREQSRPLTITGPDEVQGSGVMDMKGGLLVMQAALEAFLPDLPPNGRIVCVLSGDEEIGAPASRRIIERCAQGAFACLCFEPARESSALVRSRKGVTSFAVRCTGISGHAGTAYLTSASAIEQLCRLVGSLYALRNDARSVSVNVGEIHGGSAANVVCSEAYLNGEFRYVHPEDGQELEKQLRALCAAPGVPGTAMQLDVHAAHPPFEANDRNARMLQLVLRAGRRLGREIDAEDTGGAGDIAFASLCGAACIDGLGLHGRGMHTLEETGTISSLVRNAALSAEVMREAFACKSFLMEAET